MSMRIILASGSARVYVPLAPIESLILRPSLKLSGRVESTNTRLVYNMNKAEQLAWARLISAPGQASASSQNYIVARQKCESGPIVNLQTIGRRILVADTGAQFNRRKNVDNFDAANYDSRDNLRLAFASFTGVKDRTA